MELVGALGGVRLLNSPVGQLVLLNLGHRSRWPIDPSQASGANSCATKNPQGRDRHVLEESRKHRDRTIAATTASRRQRQHPLRSLYYYKGAFGKTIRGALTLHCDTQLWVYDDPRSMSARAACLVGQLRRVVLANLASRIAKASTPSK